MYEQLMRTLDGMSVADVEVEKARNRVSELENVYDNLESILKKFEVTGQSGVRVSFILPSGRGWLIDTQQGVEFMTSEEIAEKLQRGVWKVNLRSAEGADS